MTEASRAKHKFAVKRNSWPKTRGVAMNPVDHVRASKNQQIFTVANVLSSLTVVVTISISVKPRPSHVTLHKVKKPVLSRPGERVCSAVPRRQRIRVVASFSVDWSMVFIRFRTSQSVLALGITLR